MAEVERKGTARAKRAVARRPKAIGEASAVGPESAGTAPAAADAARRTLPLLGLTGLVLLPRMLVAVKVTDPRAANSLKAAMEGNERVLVVPQAPAGSRESESSAAAPALTGSLSSDEREDREQHETEGEGLPEAGGEEASRRLSEDARRLGVGVVASIEQVMPLDSGGFQVALHGLVRARITGVDDAADGRYPVALYDESPDPDMEDSALTVLQEKVKSVLEHLIQLLPGVPEGVVEFVRKIDSTGHLADQTGYFPEFSFEERLTLLLALDPGERLEQAYGFLKHHLGLMKLRAEILEEVKAEVGESQREGFLREQIKVIRRQLGEDEDGNEWVARMRARVESAGLAAAAKERAERELVRLERIHPHSPEVDVVRTYLEWLVELPWQAASEEANLDLKRAAVLLDEDHYGLAKVKDRILEFLAVRQLAAGKHKNPILCLVGPPGVGKTSLGRSIARVLGRPFVRVSLGGVHDEAEIRGHRRTYIGSLPGRILQGIRDAKANNPVFILDEIDKVGRDFRGDPTSALLEVLDPEQNHSFSDHYLEVPFDLSHTLFLTTANQLDPIPAPLRDRMEVIEIPGYTEAEKLEIARRFLVPKQIETHGLTAETVSFEESTLTIFIQQYTREAGVRNLERQVSAVIRKVARRVVEGESGPHAITPDDVVTFLGPPLFDAQELEEADQVGVATGVAVTEAGGDVLPIEVGLIEGTGKVILTGHLGDVMKESARAAITYARARVAEYGIKGKYFEKHDIHIHVPQGAVPKDGPSAGVAMATALVSALTNVPVARWVAMTGEITLRGRVLPVGGIKEKALAAQRAGVRTFLLPAKNAKDIPELPEAVRQGLRLIPVSHMDQVLPAVLVRPEPGRSVPAVS